PGAVVAPASVPGVDRGPGREVVRQQAPLAAGADQVEDGVEHLAQFGRRPAGALGPGEERLDEGELVIGQVSVITLGSHNPFYGSEPGFRTGSQVVYAEGDGTAFCRAGEVMFVNLFSLSAPYPSVIPERANQLLLLGIDADNWITPCEERMLLESNVSELLVSLGAARFDLPSPVRLQ